MHAAVKEPIQAAPEWDLQTLIHQLEHEPESRRHLAEVLAEDPKADRLQMSYAEFLEWAEEDTLAEWVHGEVIMSSPASFPHQELVKFLTRILSMFVEFRNLGIVIHAPFQMKMEHGREPDLLFLAAEHLDRLRDAYLDGPADLVVEVISPESIGRDRGDKFYEYERGGIPEYWLIDPLTQRVEFYQLDDTTAQYRLIQPEAEDRYLSRALPGFWLRVDWLWQQPLPHPLHVLGEIAGVDSQEVERFMRLLTRQ